jgi:hypothetical protein
LKIANAGLALTVLAFFYLATSSSLADDIVPTVQVLPVPNGGKPIVARIDTAGTIHVLYDTNTGPAYAKSSDAGHTFGTTISVIGDDSPPTGLEYAAWDMAIGKAGRIHVAMGTNAWKLKLPQEEWGFFHASLDPSASVFSPVRNINRKPSEGFSIAADNDGNVTACWLSDRLYANVSHDNGDTFEHSIEIDANLNPCNCCTTSAAYGQDGKLAVLYREETNNDRDMYLVLWDQKRRSTTKTLLSQARWKIDACPMTYFTVTPDRDGFVAVWPTKGQIRFARTDNIGRRRDPGEVDTLGRSGMRTGVIALSRSDGTTLVAWKLAGQTTWQYYDANGQPKGPTGSFPSAGNGVAGVVAKDGRFILIR